MDLLKYKDLIEEGDLIIVYLDVRHLYPLTVKQNEVFQSKYGALRHNDCIGKKFGSCISCTKGWVYVLFPTAELWTLALPHRTQILYSADISLIVMQLDLKPGSVVCEAGTGSGSLTHALARAVGSTGAVFTFDFHAQRVDAARAEFSEHGLQEIVRVEHRDVCSDGLPVGQVMDAVFLDLPNPWEVVPLTRPAFKSSGGRICTFSPCIEQAQRTCEALRLCGFSDVTCVECLQRPHDVRKVVQPTHALQEDENRTADCNKATEHSANSLGPRHKKLASVSNDNEFVTFWTAVPSSQAPGHTGYLTYASYFPLEATEP